MLTKSKNKIVVIENCAIEAADDAGESPTTVFDIDNDIGDCELTTGVGESVGAGVGASVGHIGSAITAVSPLSHSSPWSKSTHDLLLAQNRQLGDAGWYWAPTQ